MPSNATHKALESTFDKQENASRWARLRAKYGNALVAQGVQWVADVRFMGQCAQDWAARGWIEDPQRVGWEVALSQAVEAMPTVLQEEQRLAETEAQVARQLHGLVQRFGVDGARQYLEATGQDVGFAEQLYRAHVLEPAQREQAEMEAAKVQARIETGELKAAGYAAILATPEFQLEAARALAAEGQGAEPGLSPGETLLRATHLLADRNLVNEHREPFQPKMDKQETTAAIAKQLNRDAKATGDFLDLQEYVETEQGLLKKAGDRDAEAQKVLKGWEPTEAERNVIVQREGRRNRLENYYDPRNAPEKPDRYETPRGASVRAAYDAIDSGATHEEAVQAATPSTAEPAESSLHQALSDKYDEIDRGEANEA